MPVVFTSMLGMSLDGKAIDQAMTSTLGDPVHVFTQTPQVWLDHQVMEIDGELVFSWYCMEDVLADGLIDSLFKTSC
ncbi:yersiniabactin polyketide/non-ribosomal peptide synthetase, partial [Pseudomonas savastanoi pv. glycinea str. race 4]